MATIIPAILPKSRADLDEKLAAVRGLVQLVQIDVVDGRFVGPPSWPYTEGEQGSYSLPYLGELRYEMDLMVSDPEKVSGQWITAGAERIVLHAESSRFVSKAVTDIQVLYGHSKDFVPELLSLGIAVNLSTELSFIEPFIDHVNYVQFMGIRTIGAQAQPFDQRIFKKISDFKMKHPEMPVQVDGGVSLRTAPSLLQAGVDRLIIGSGFWNAPDISARLKEFEELVQEYGIYS